LRDALGPLFQPVAAMVALCTAEIRSTAACL
jgi:hypothetical protein